MTHAGEARPRFSVVIATYNRPGVLARTLERLTAEHQRVSPDSFEIIVTDNSRNLDTRVFVEQTFPNVRYVKGPGFGPAANRNRGAAHARGEWIAFIDDDCRPVDGWMAAMQRAADGNASVIEGRIVAPDKIDSPFRRHVENVSGGLYWSGNLAIRLDEFGRLGRFDEDFQEAADEDFEFGDRLRRSGMRVVFCPEATVIHPSHRVSWSVLFRRAFRIKWRLLYLVKTGHAVPAEESAWRSVAFVVEWRLMNLLRLTWRAVRVDDPTQRWTALFDVTFAWALLPIILPYLVYWDLRFRRMFAGRQGRRAGGEPAGGNEAVK